MESIHTILLVLQVVVAVGLIGIILIQHGKGADAGAAFGSGASSTVFGSQGSGNFLTKTTAVLAFVFLANSLTLAYISTKRIRTEDSLMINVETAVEETTEAANDMEMEVPMADDLADMMADDEMPSIPQSPDEIPAAPEDSDIPTIPTEQQTNCRCGGIGRHAILRG